MTKRLLVLALTATVLAGCGTGNHRDDPTMDIISGRALPKEPTVERTVKDRSHIHGLDYTLGDDELPDNLTVVKKYEGKPPVGINLTLDKHANIYRAVRIEENEWGKTLVYASDLGEMTLELEKGNKKRGITAVVPYALCLDFIDENLGARDGGWRIVGIKCAQDELGSKY